MHASKQHNCTPWVLIQAQQHSSKASTLLAKAHVPCTPIAIMHTDRQSCTHCPHESSTLVTTQAPALLATRHTHGACSLAAARSMQLAASSPARTHRANVPHYPSVQLGIVLLSHAHAARVVMWHTHTPSTLTLLPGAPPLIHMFGALQARGLTPQADTHQFGAGRCMVNYFLAWSTGAWPQGRWGCSQRDSSPPHLLHSMRLPAGQGHIPSGGWAFTCQALLLTITGCASGHDHGSGQP